MENNSSEEATIGNFGNLLLTTTKEKHTCDDEYIDAVLYLAVLTKEKTKIRSIVIECLVQLLYKQLSSYQIKKLLDYFVNADDLEPSFRENAIGALANFVILGPKLSIAQPIFGILTNLAKLESNASLRAIAFKALGNVRNPRQELIDVWLHGLDDLEPTVQIASLKSLPQNSPSEIISIIAKKATDATTSVATRVACFQILIKHLNNEEARNALEIGVEDEQFEVGNSIVEGLAEIFSPSDHAINVLARAASNTNESIRKVAIERLAALRKPNQRAIEALVKVAESDIPFIRVIAIESLRDPSEQLLLKAANFPDASIREIAIKKLAECRNPSKRMMEVLFNVANGSDTSLRGIAIKKFAKLNNPSVQVMEVLLKAANDSDLPPPVRERVISADGLLNNVSEQVIEALLQAVNDFNLSGPGREKAIKCLGQLRIPGLDSILKNIILRDKDDAARHTAIETLLQITPANELKDTLLKAATDSNLSVRDGRQRTWDSIACC